MDFDCESTSEDSVLCWYKWVSIKMFGGSVNVMMFTILGQFYVPKLQNQKFSRLYRAPGSIKNFCHFLYHQAHG